MTMEILKMMETGKGRQVAGLCLGLCNSRMVKISRDDTNTPAPVKDSIWHHSRFEETADLRPD